MAAGHWLDELARELATRGTSRRAALRRLGVGLAASLLGPLAQGCKLIAADRWLPSPDAWCESEHADRPNRCRLGDQQICCRPWQSCREALGGLSCAGPQCGPGAFCSADAACCGGACIGVLRDPRNCGGCEVTCPPGTRCIEGACTCPDGRPTCGGGCWAGACCRGERCGDGAICDGGACLGGKLCGGTQGPCAFGCCSGGVCAAGTADQACGPDGGPCRACPSGQTCRDGVCVAGCTPGAGNCD